MRLIDADALKEFIDVGRLRSPSEICFSELDVVNILNNAPTIDPMKHGEKLKSPFVNDPFALVHIAFEHLFPSKKYIAEWTTEIESGNGQPAFGVTDFQPDGNVYVFVKSDLLVQDAAEVFAHELAHVAVGLEHFHDAIWEKAFADIQKEYFRIGSEIFGERK